MGVYYPRYGKFCFRDFYWDVISLLLFVLLAIVLAVTRVALWGVPMLLLFAGLWIWLISSAFRERFSLREGRILAKKGRKETIITLPGTLTLIITSADLDSNRFFHGPYYFYQSPNRIHGAYAVTILQNTALSDAQQALEKGLGRTADYTNSKVHFCFEGQAYVYSFVLNIPALEILLSKYDCSVLIPERFPALEQIAAHCTKENIEVYHFLSGNK